MVRIKKLKLSNRPCQNRPSAAVETATSWGPSDVSQENGILGLFIPQSNRVSLNKSNNLSGTRLPYLERKRRGEGGREGWREEELNKIPPSQRALKHEEKSAFFSFS